MQRRRSDSVLAALVVWIGASLLWGLVAPMPWNLLCSLFVAVVHYRHAERRRLSHP